MSIQLFPECIVDDGVVATITVSITRERLIAFLNCINGNYSNQNDNITIEEVMNNSDLLTYIVEEAIFCEAINTPFDFWSNGGWCDVEDYR